MMEQVAQVQAVLVAMQPAAVMEEAAAATGMPSPSATANEDRQMQKDEAKAKTSKLKKVS